MRLVVAGYFQGVRGRAVGPEPLPIKPVNMQRQERLNRTEPEGLAVFEQIDARRHDWIDGKLESGAELGRSGFSELRPDQRQGEESKQDGAARRTAIVMCPTAKHNAWFSL